jgi:hypothetical protein
MIFVTSGMGMVGGEIVRLLSQNGTAARPLVHNPKNAKNLKSYLGHRRSGEARDITRGVRRC